ncbi:MAG: RIP metalloprotease RseP [Eubacteriaceae bacterium]|nr:RIP metalloprotease RseP [Eubacteriaceae bacterium]
MDFKTIFISIIIFGFLIIIHELGHFLAARLFGVKVLEFAIGMGPLLFSRQGEETLYSIRMIPLGGFCKMQGEDESDYTEGSYNSKTKLQRIMILASGAIMNIIGAVVLLTIVFFIIGIPTSVIENVEKGYPAYASGMKPEDKIVSINGQEINSWEDISGIIDDAKEKKYSVTVLRDEKEVDLSITSKYDETLKRYRVGITPHRDKNVFLALTGGVTQSWEYTKLMLASFIQLFTGKVSTNDLMGPIGVVTIVGETVQYGAGAVLNLAALISLNLAIFNLLPIPALDGSRIMFVLIEWIKGSPVDPEKEGMVHFIGFALLMALAVFIAYKDILRMN